MENSVQSDIPVHSTCKTPELQKTNKRPQPKPWSKLPSTRSLAWVTKSLSMVHWSQKMTMYAASFFPQSSCYHTRHLTFFFHQVFKGLPFYIVWDVADKHAVSFVHISVGFVAPASASLLGSLFPACIGLMLGFSIQFSVG